MKRVFVWIAVLGLTWCPMAVSAESADVAALRETGRAFTRIAREVTPAVVSIRAEQEVTRTMPDLGPFEFFFGPQFRRPETPSPRYQLSQGSGFIVTEDGYIFTNNHVVQEAASIRVTLKDGREFDAEVVGTDPDTEIALIKIDGEDLPAAPLGDSDAIEVGEWAIAIGNPFGLQESVTIGIISATGRDRVGIADFENFIQTDAAINPGNSGGPLLNIDGEVLGINTAIFTRSGGYMGIGFAIPINMAVDVKEALIRDGRVERSLIGIYLQELTAELAEAFELDHTDGILIAQVGEDTAGEEAGLRGGDVIVALNGEEPGAVSHFRRRIAAMPPGTEVSLTVMRDGEEKEIAVVTRARDPQETAAQPDPEVREQAGLEVADVTPDLQRQLRLPADTEGVLVRAVEHGSPAWRAGLRRGMVILTVNRTDITSVADFDAALTEARGGQAMMLVHLPRAGRRYVVMPVPADTD